MRLKNFIDIKILVTTVALIFFSFASKGQTVTKTYNPAGTISVDGVGNYGTSLGGLTFNSSDFPNGCVVTDVNVRIRWAKTDGTCTAPGTGNSFHAETSFRLQGPTGTQVVLIRPGAYSGSATTPIYTTILNQGSPVIGGTNPVGGTFGPNNGNLNDFNGTNGLGTWVLQAGDSAGGDPLCIDWYQVIVTVAAGAALNPGSHSTTTVTSCTGYNPNLPATAASGGSTPYSYQWQVNGANVGVTTEDYNPAALNTAGTYVYRRQVTDACGDISYTNTKTINIVADPSITLAGATTICPGLTTNLTASPSGGTGTCNNIWQSGPSNTGPWTTLATNASNTFTTPALTADTYFRVRRDCSPGPCNIASSNVILVVATESVPPVLNGCPGNITIGNDATNCSAAVTWTPPTATDNCGTPTVTSPSSSGDVFPVGSTTVTYTANDGNGNTSTCSFVVTVNDTEDPQITCPAGITANSDLGICGAIVNYTAPVGTDNCPGQTTAQTAGLASGATFPVGNTTNTFVVTDAAGNNETCSFIVTVNDTEDPQITCPANITTNNDAGVCGAVVNYTAPTGTDNCPGQATTQVAGLASGATFPVGNTTNTFLVTDAAGNNTTCSFTVTINDTEDPIISCPSDITANNDIGVCGAVVTFTDPVGTDNCPGQTTAQTAGLPSGSTFPVGTTINTFTVTDAAGNNTSCSFNVIINDAEDPQITCPADINFATGVGVCEAVITYATPVNTDNCPGQTILQTAGIPSGDLFPIGTTTNTFEVTDAAGNTATCSFDVVVTLDGAPLDFIVANPNICIGDGILASQSGGSPVVGTNPGDSGTYSGLGVTNNGNGTYDFDPVATGTGVHTVAYTYLDGAGCTLFITKEVEVFESPIASITCPDPIVKDCLGPFNCNPTDLNPATIVIASGAVSGTAAPYTYGDPSPGGDFFIDFPNMPVDTPLELIYTVTTTDGCTNSTSCTFEITSKQADAGKY